MKIEVGVEDNDYLDGLSLHMATSFMIKDLFKEHENKDFTYCVHIDNDTCFDVDMPDSFTYANENESLYSTVLIKNLVKCKKTYGGSKHIKNQILHCILSEMFNALEILSQWDGTKSLEQVENQILEKNQAIYEKYKMEGKGCNPPPDVIKSQQFAFKHMHYFREVYEYKGPLAVEIPDE